MKQTAIEWLVKKLSYETSDGTIISHHLIINKLVEQAKAMEKEQIIDAYDAGLFDGTMDDVNDRMHKQYYNEQYGN